MSGYTAGIDVGQGYVSVEDRVMKPSAEYPDGSWLHTVDGKVEVATGFYALEYPDKPSPYWHGKPPFLIVDTQDWAWEWERKDEVKECTALSVRPLQQGILGKEEMPASRGSLSEES